jgi:hypothetical protein
MTASHSVQDCFPGQSCSLKDAAGAAQEIAAAEHLPISAVLNGNAQAWHLAALLKTVPVYGKRNAKSERVPAEAELDGEAGCALDGAAWTALTVKRTDFRRYLDWLHSFW